MQLVRSFTVVIGLLVFNVSIASAQQDTTRRGMPGMPVPKQDTSRKKMPAMAHRAQRDTMPETMSMEGPLGISMERMGSGTTWTPDAAMLPARHFMKGGWSLMLHGFAFAQYDRQGSKRGDDQ